MWEHAIQMYESIKTRTSRSSCEGDIWFQQISDLVCDNVVIRRICVCGRCGFKTVIPSNVRSQLEVPMAHISRNHSTKLVMPVDDDSTLIKGESNQILRPDVRKEHLNIPCKKYQSLPQPGEHDCLKFLNQYFGNEPFRSVPYGNRHLKKWYEANYDCKAIYINPYSGALFVPCCNLLVHSQASNEGMFADHHALAYSSTDHIDGCMHVIVLQELSEPLQVELITTKRKTKFIPKSWKTHVQLTGVSSPREPQKKTIFFIEVVSIPVFSNPASNKGKGR